MTHRATLLSFCLAAVLAVSASAQAPAAPKMTVYKSPTCGCCAKWVESMKRAGFAVTVNDVENVPLIKVTHHVPTDLAACHTALVEGYVVEGHVPADVIMQLLKDKPKVIGISVAGMPMGSPGMETEGVPHDHFNVMAFDQSGTSHIYAAR
jgi:hypothetical protein